MVKGSDFTLSTVIEADTKELFNPLYDYRYLLLLMTLFLLPMLGLFWWMSTRYLTDPLKLMVGQAKEIESGNLGYQLEKDTKSLEFEYLRESYNHMSRTLKYQFDHIYEEELALRDARIMALQSHINPHFMNNTLEIINWEARLGENEKVSRMIESLSVLMNAAMDRKKLPEITLSEEMIYVDAYLRIHYPQQMMKHSSYSHRIRLHSSWMVHGKSVVLLEHASLIRMIRRHWTQKHLINLM